MTARILVGDLCPVCANGAVICEFKTLTDEMECCLVSPWGSRIYSIHWHEDVLIALEKTEEQLPKKKVIDEFPHTCPYCGAKAYLGITPGTTVHHKWASEAWSCDSSRKLRQGPAR